MKTRLPLLAVAAATFAIPAMAVPGLTWTISYHGTEDCSDSGSGASTLQTGNVCDSNTKVPDGTVAISVCNKDQTTEGAIFYSDDACTDVVAFEGLLDPNKCGCVGTNGVGAINSAMTSQGA